jgi:phosphoserine phosphatase
VAPSAWTLLAERLGANCLERENETKRIWNKGGYRNYLEWMRATVDLHREFGLNEELFLSVIESVEFTPGTDTVLANLHESGWITVVITGGFKALADRVQRRLKIQHAFAGCDYFFNAESGLVEHINLLPADEMGKVDFMRLMCREYGADASECVFVGDGKNDRHLASEVGYSIAFNGQPELIAVTSASVVQAIGSEDFSPVGALIRDHFEIRAKIEEG